MNALLSSAGISISAVFLSAILGEMGYKGARLISTTALVVVILCAAGSIAEILSVLGWLIDGEEIEGCVGSALKILGIGYISGICHDVSLEMGHKGIADSLLMVGRVEMLLVVAPALSEMLKSVLGMI